MASSPAFEWTCEQLEGATDLDRLAARGTMRLALKQAGLDPDDVTSERVAVVLRKLMPGELEMRGVADSDRICRELADRVEQLETPEDQPSTPEHVFSRFAG